MQLSDPTNLNGILQDLYFEGKFNSSTFLANDLLRIINKYYGQCQDLINAVNEDFFMIQAVADLQTGDGTYTFPDGTGTAPAYLKVKNIKVAMTPANTASPQPTEFIKCTIIDPNQVSDESYVFGAPTVIVYGNYFILLPLTTTFVTKGVKVTYIPVQTPLANATDIPNIYPSLVDAIVWGSLTEIAPRLQNDSLEAKAIKKWEQRQKDITNYASNRIMNMAGDVVEGQDASGGWLYPFGGGDLFGVGNVSDGE